MLNRRPSTTTILVAIGILLLVLPISGIYFLRIYESALIRQTESELISQAAFVSSLYKQEVSRSLKKHKLTNYGLPIKQNRLSSSAIHPIPAHLDLSRDLVYPPRPFPQSTQDHLDIVADEAGKQVLTVLPDVQQVTLSGIKVLNYQGMVAAGQGERGLSFAHTLEFQKARKGLPVSLLRRRRMPKTIAALSSNSRNSTINVFVALPIILENRLIGIAWVNRTPTDLPQALYGKRREIAWLTLLIISTALVIVLFTSYTITQPIRALVEKTRQITKGAPEGLEALKNPVTAEVSELSESLASMARTLKRRNEYILDFARHVSHEFKTPLTSIQGSIELLQDNLDAMPDEQKKRFLSNMAQDTERLRQLVTRLLELARADMKEPGSECTSPLDILENLAVRYHSKGLVIRTVGQPEGLSARISYESLEAVLGNLFENSLQAGATQVDLTIHQEGDSVAMDIQDNGSGISTGDQSNIFTPFFTTRRTEGGSGLGLSITQSLLEKQGGSIRLAPCPAGACFSVRLPVA